MTALLAITLPWLLALLHLVGPVPADLGLQGDSLRPCPSPAHCAQRQWPVNDTTAAFAALEHNLQTTPRTIVVTTDSELGYLHATASSSLFGFVDDIEVHADNSRGLIEARSESRLGDSDLGVNARRLDAMAEALR